MDLFFFILRIKHNPHLSLSSSLFHNRGIRLLERLRGAVERSASEPASHISQLLCGLPSCRVFRQPVPVSDVSRLPERRVRGRLLRRMQRQVLPEWSASAVRERRVLRVLVELQRDRVLRQDSLQRHGDVPSSASAVSVAVWAHLRVRQQGVCERVRRDGDRRRDDGHDKDRRLQAASCLGRISYRGSDGDCRSCDGRDDCELDAVDTCCRGWFHVMYFLACERAQESVV